MASRQWQFQFPATLKDTDSCCLNLRSQISDTVLGADLFAVLLLLREALANAVVHGCGCDAAKTVSCRVRLDEQSVILEIEDPGPGFNWRHAMTQSPDPASASGRGLQIYALYSDRIDYNERGNRITIVRGCRQGEHHEQHPSRP